MTRNYIWWAEQVLIFLTIWLLAPLAVAIFTGVSATAYGIPVATFALAIIIFVLNYRRVRMASLAALVAALGTSMAALATAYALITGAQPTEPAVNDFGFPTHGTCIAAFPTEDPFGFNSTPSPGNCP